ncbi:MAG: MarR family winged helix-turn-helix transcriptional regulator [Desulfonatronovibrionaceae bacterium]
MKQIEELSKLLVEFYEKFSSWEHGVVRGEPLTLSQMHTVEILSAQGALAMKELAEKMGITTGTLTVLVDRLEEAGMVERKPHETDRRSIRVQLTEKGRAHARDHHKLHNHLTRELTSDMSPEEMEALAGCLRKMLVNF